MSKISRAQWLNRVGQILGLLGVLFLAYKLFQYQSELDFQNWGIANTAALLGLCLLYGLANLSLTAGWHFSLKYLEYPQEFKWTLNVYAVTQLGKYLPGNIFQFAGRQAMGAAVGIPQKKLALSSLIEVFFLTLAAASYAPTVLPTYFAWISREVSLLLCLLTISIGLIVTALLKPAALSKSGLGYWTQVLTSSSIFVGVYLLAGGTVSSWDQFFVIAGGFSVAWLIGLLTPGAPAGLGVREAAIVLFLAEVAPAPIVLKAALLGRLVTTIGDLLFYLANRVAQKQLALKSH
ncbi:hypothetical protein [Limoniibacter endophyticus]|uniref:Lysylphosphatidylglycerol synthase-like protein n=1 Tax=Limoniibacter endophyticus TaxID=1565040 RepID=A0A8J3DHS8_9HYPH|nr:hypothetical protein [Limoniibacter endophyticus]GHC68067.1 hypothetical protein GCM10010136_12810 [Limoniibacter endophyticus]